LGKAAKAKIEGKISEIIKFELFTKVYSYLKKGFLEISGSISKQ
jgi:hypothetical protein